MTCREASCCDLDRLKCITPMTTFAHSVFDAIASLETDAFQFLRDPCCQGSRMLSCFRSNRRCYAERYCQPDIIGTLEGSVRLIIEIDEAGDAGMSPKLLTGKPHAAAMCKYLIDPGAYHVATEMCDVVFIQVLNTHNLRRGSQKLQQYVFLERDINQHLSPVGCVRSYALIAGTQNDLTQGAQYDRLRAIIGDIIVSHEDL